MHETLIKVICARKKTNIWPKKLKISKFLKIENYIHWLCLLYNLKKKTWDMRPEKLKISQKSIIHAFTWILVIGDGENLRFGKKSRSGRKNSEFFAFPTFLALTNSFLLLLTLLCFFFFDLPHSSLLFSLFFALPYSS